MSDILVEDLLEHHGIKGQKWGIRNEKVNNSNNSKKSFRLTKKQVAIGSGILVGLAASAVILHNKGVIKSSVLKRGFEESTQERSAGYVDELLAKHGNTKDTSFPKGTIFTRLSNVAETEIKGGEYAVHDPTDVARYRSFWGSEKTRHEISIKAIDEVKVPGLNTRFKTMGEVINEPVPGVTKKGQTLRAYIRKVQPTWRSKVYVHTAPSEELGKYTYGRMVGGSYKTGLGKAYAEKLVSKGFGAMQDDNDATNNLAKNPLVLLKKGLFKITSNNKMSKSDIDSAYATFKKTLSA